jgi:hypothetical protein
LGGKSRGKKIEGPCIKQKTIRNFGREEMYQEKEEYFVSSVKTCDSNHLLEAPQEFKMQTHNTLNNIHSSSLKLEALLLVFLSLTEYQVFTKLEELSTEKQPDTQQNVYFRDEK